MTVEEFDAKLKEMLQELSNKGILVDHISVVYHHTMEKSYVGYTDIDLRFKK